MKYVVDNLQVREPLHLKLIRVQVCLDSLLNYRSVIYIIFLFGRDYFPSIGHATTDVNFDVLGFDDLWEMLQAV